MKTNNNQSQVGFKKPNQLDKSYLQKLLKSFPDSAAEISKLGVGFSKFEESKLDKLAKIQKPIIHGTGSMALEGILSHGFIPQSGEEVLHGERSAINHGASDIRPISFAEFDSAGQGEAVAHFYAMLVGGQSDLIFDSAKATQEDRVERFFRTINSKGIEEGINLKTARAILKSKPDKNPKATRAWIKKDTEQKIALMSQPGAYTFNQDEMKSNIALLQRILDNDFSNPKALSKRLMRLDCLNDVRYYYSERGDKPEPWSKIDELSRRAAKDMTKPKSLIRIELKQKLKSMKYKLAKFKNMTSKERDQISSQYPCVIILEGYGLKLTPVDWMITCQELHCETSVSPDKIRQIRVPKIHISRLKTRLEESGLANVEIIPIEYYEMEAALH